MLLRIYTTIQDEFGVASVVRIGHTFGSVQKAAVAARRVSRKYGMAELKDDSRSIYDRLLEVFRDGRPVLGRLDY